MPEEIRRMLLDQNIPQNVSYEKRRNNPCFSGASDALSALLGIGTGEIPPAAWLESIGFSYSRRRT